MAYEYGIITEPSSYLETGGNYEMGWAFTVGNEDIKVSGLRMKVPATQTITAYLWPLNSPISVASVENITINANEWTEGYFAESVTLTAGASYTISFYNNANRYYALASSFEFNPKITYVSGKFGTQKGTVPQTDETGYVHPIIDIIIETPEPTKPTEPEYDEKYAVKSEWLVSVADEVRRLTGSEDLLTVEQIETALKSVEVGGGDGGVSNGYDVSFVSKDEETVAFFSVKQEMSIYAPVCKVEKWQDANGAVIAFPYTPVADITFYEASNTYLTALYDFYGVDGGVYPYVLIVYSPTPNILIYFTKGIRFGSYQLNYEECYEGSAGISLSEISAENMVNAVLENIASVTISTGGSWPNSAKYYIASNVDMSSSPFSGNFVLE